MVIYIGADHRGFALKESIKTLLQQQGHEIFDMGAASLDPSDDFPVFARKVAEAVAAMPETARGIVMCGSGAGVTVAANKVKGVRAVTAFSPEEIVSARHDDDVNVLTIAADFTDEVAARQYVDAFLKTPFGGDDRYRRRLKEIEDIEGGHV